jgi:endonuclease YncB( thermonuclease family)
MRLRTGLFVFLGLLAASALVLWRATAPPPPPVAAVQLPPAPVEAPPAAAPPADTPHADTPTADTPPAAEAPPPEPALPDLQQVKVAERPIHSVPQDSGPPPSSGQPLDLRGGTHPTGESDEVRMGAHALTPPSAPRQFSGSATASGGIELKVDTTPVSLFGIKRAADQDRCGTDADSDCAAAAKHALAERLSAAGKISCRIPNPHPGITAFAICLDANGVDLSGFLIAQGLALADTGQSYDYVGAESIARNLRRGLWKFR